MREGRQKYSGHKVYAVACVPKRAQQHDKPQHQHKKQSGEAAKLKLHNRIFSLFYLDRQPAETIYLYSVYLYSTKYEKNY